MHDNAAVAAGYGVCRNVALAQALPCGMPRVMLLR
jgi:hypothetical protein